MFTNLLNTTSPRKEFDNVSSAHIGSRFDKQDPASLEFFKLSKFEDLSRKTVLFSFFGCGLKSINSVQLDSFVLFVSYLQKETSYEKFV